MSIPCFYCPELNEKMIINEDSVISLSETESSHAIRSRRLREGDSVHLLSGRGVIGKGQIKYVDKKNVRVKLDSFEQFSSLPQNLVIATAIPKGDRQKVMVDMLTQLGVQEIFPLVCEHSVTRYSENLGEKWRRAAIEACKQSHNPWLPIIHQGHTIEQLNECDDYCMVFADAKGLNMPMVVDKAQAEGKPLLVLIGPEGGFSKSEINYFSEREIGSVSFGNYILRTEAATVAAMAQFAHNLV